MASEIQLRLYEELNDFLPLDKRKRRFAYQLEIITTVEELLASLGVPDPHVELVLVNGNSVDYSCLLKNGDIVSIYPVIESLDVRSIVRVRKTPLRQIRFMVEPSLPSLTVYLRLFGFDTLASDSREREEMIREAEEERRILLTRDAALLQCPEITRIYLVRGAKPRNQLIEVLSRYDLYGSAVPFGRCLTCNGVLMDRNESNECKSGRGWSCSACKRIYRSGLHFSRLQSLVNRILNVGANAE